MSHKKFVICSDAIGGLGSLTSQPIHSWKNIYKEGYHFIFEELFALLSAIFVSDEKLIVTLWQSVENNAEV